MTNTVTRIEPTISYSFVSALCESLRLQHDSVDRALHQFGLADLDPNTKRVALSRYIGLFEQIAKDAGRPRLGLELSQLGGPETLGAMGYLFLGARNLETALTNFGHYLRALQDGSRLYLGVDGEYAFIHYEVLDDRITRRRQDSEYSLAYVWRMMQIFSNDACNLTMVEFEHDRSQRDLKHFKRIFKAPVSFRRRFNRLHFRRELLANRPKSADPNLFPILESHTRAMAFDAERVASFSDQVRSSLTPDALADSPRAAFVAKRFGISESTLHRRLRAEETSFKKLLDDAAKSQALYLMSQKRLSISTIARRLGYAETACLTRAFRRWFGQSPTEYRRTMHT